MPTLITQIEYVTFEAVDGLPAVPTGTPAWRGLDYVQFNKMGPRVGDNRGIPGETGRLETPREIDELKLSLQMRIKGRFDWEGTPYDDAFEGVQTNLDYLVENVLSYVPSRAITFHRRDGSTKTGNATIEDWDSAVDPNSGGDVHLLVIPMTIAAGYLTPLGS